METKKLLNKCLTDIDKVVIKAINNFNKVKTKYNYPLSYRLLSDILEGYAINEAIRYTFDGKDYNNLYLMKCYANFMVSRTNLEQVAYKDFKRVLLKYCKHNDNSRIKASECMGLWGGLKFDIKVAIANKVRQGEATK